MFSVLASRHGAVISCAVLTSLRVKNFKRLEDVEIELGKTVVFVGPNNSGKTTALQALALWEIGLRKWVEKRSAKDTPEKRPGVTINRRDLIAVPVPEANLLWRDLHVRAIQRKNGEQETRNIRIDILVSGVTNGTAWECGFEFDYANPESFYCRPLRTENHDAHAGAGIRGTGASCISAADVGNGVNRRPAYRTARSMFASARGAQPRCSGTCVFRFIPVPTRLGGKSWSLKSAACLASP